jgi:hypothetical protein
MSLPGACYVARMGRRPKASESGGIYYLGCEICGFTIGYPTEEAVISFIEDHRREKHPAVSSSPSPSRATNLTPS